MSVIADDDIIDQTDYEEFANVPDRAILEEETPDEVAPMELPPLDEITPDWQIATEHTFVQEHFCKVTSCEYCGKIIASIRWHQGLRCKECSFDSHYDCAPLAPKNCLSLHNDAPLRPDILQPHTFYEKHFSSVTFCNVCRKMLYGLGKQGFACATCQFISHEDCLAKAAVNCPPQKLEAPLSDDLRHYWVEGNLSGSCAMCRQSLSKMTILYGFRCSYCTLKVCPACFPQFQTDACDEGPLAPLKLGPGHIITNASDIYKKWTISVPEDRRPLMVFINKRSGGQVGKLIAQRLSRVLNPNQIIDLSQGGPMPMLKVMQRLKVPYRILACGGDGTAAWLLSALDKLIEKGAAYVPPVAVLPLGTGNDLARVLGWGGGYDNEAMAPICAKIEAGHEVLLDRWRLDIENVGIVDGVKHPKIMNNYFSIGIDAKIALDFHRKREANPSQFKSRGMNKVIYAGLGAGAIFDGCANLSKVLQLELDGQLVVLPKSLEGIMVLNLSSWAGGKNPWGKPARSEGRAAQSPCDGLFELIGVTSSFHLGQIQAYMNDGIRLGQGRDVTFRWLTTDILPVQLDGEPWEEPQSIIRVSFHRQSRMIASPSENVWDKSQWLDPLPFTSPSGEKTSSPKRSQKANPDELIEIDPTIASSSNATDKPKKKSKKGKKPSPLTSSTGSLQTGDLIQLDPASTAISEDAAASSSAVLDLTTSLEPLTIAEAQLDAPPRLPKKKRSAANSDPALPVLDVLELSGSEALKRSQEAPASTHPATDAPLDQLDF